MSDFSVSVVIPTLNEGETIGEVIKEIPKDQAKISEIIIVDGGSTDGTVEKAKIAGADRVIIERRRGYGLAYQIGFAQAKGDVLVMIDADMTYPASYIPQLLEPIQDGTADMVLGSRFKGGMETGSMSITNKFGNVLITKLVAILFRLKITDSQSGLRAIRAKKLKKIVFKERGMPFATELLIRAKSNDLKISEVPIYYRSRKGGQAKLNSIRDGAIIFRAILKNFLMRYR